MCGICGIVSYGGTDASRDINIVRNMIQRLRHRGYDSWGTAATNTTGEILVLHSCQPVQSEQVPQLLSSQSNFHSCIGHTRYTTRGSCDDLTQAQPLVNAAGNLSLVHNGQIEFNDVSISGMGISDTQHLLHQLESEFESLPQLTQIDLLLPEIENRFGNIFCRINGSYACLMQLSGVGTFAFRDPRGIRPLCFQHNRDEKNIRFASESSAFEDSATPVQYVSPGEVLWINLKGEVHRLHPLPEPKFFPECCLFEFIYLAHDDSIIDGINVGQARELMGELLAPRIREVGLHPDVIIPVPHTPVLAGKRLANVLGIQFVEALDVISRKARRESRTFILPTQTARENAVRQKFSIRPAAAKDCRGKRVLILDDSIVRGTTLRHVVKLVRLALQPAEIYVASLSPPIVSPNRYGIDIPSRDLLIAAQGLEHVQASLGLNAPVVYQKLDVLENGLRALSTTGVAGFEHSVFIP